MTAQIRISHDGHVGHPKDVIIGQAKVCFNEFKQIWVTPGGGIKFTQQGAEKYCSKLNDFICAGGRHAVKPT